jgi:hypothetical protein
MNIVLALVWGPSMLTAEETCSIVRYPALSVISADTSL